VKLMKGLAPLFLALLCLGVTLLVSRPAPAAPPPSSTPVTVTNTPLPVQGTVAVSSLPAIPLSNTNATPLYVRDVDNSAQQPFSQSCQLDAFNVASGSFPSCQFAGPPAGKRFVIESVSADLALTSGSKPNVLVLTYASGGGGAEVFFPATFMNSNPFFSFPDHYVISQQVKLYADGGQGLSFNVNITDSGSGTISACLAGHLVNIP
jgi:hypothetical protein